MEETKATKYSIFKTDIIKVSLLFSISNFFINKIALANIWISFSCSNLPLQQIVSHSSSKQFLKQNTRATLSYFWSVHVKKKLGSHPSSHNWLQCCILFEVAFKFLSPSPYPNFGNWNFIEILAPLCNVHPLSWHLYMMRNRSTFFFRGLSYNQVLPLPK
jgi:hypothetical protein